MKDALFTCVFFAVFAPAGRSEPFILCGLFRSHNPLLDLHFPLFQPHPWLHSSILIQFSIKPSFISLYLHPIHGISIFVHESCLSLFSKSPFCPLSVFRFSLGPQHKTTHQTGSVGRRSFKNKKHTQTQQTTKTNNLKQNKQHNEKLKEQNKRNETTK